MNTAFPDVQPISRRFWQARFEALAESGLSCNEYCRCHHLSSHAATLLGTQTAKARQPHVAAHSG